MKKVRLAIGVENISLNIFGEPAGVVGLLLKKQLCTVIYFEIYSRIYRIICSAACPEAMPALFLSDFE
jgi:hypothetical protein